MPRNTGGRKARMGSDSMLNYKGMPDYDAGNVHVQKNLNVAGHSVLNNVTVNRLTVTNATLSTFEVPVVTSNPTLAGGQAPSSAGLITVDNTAGSGKMYFSRLDETSANEVAAAETANTNIQADTLIGDVVTEAAGTGLQAVIDEIDQGSGTDEEKLAAAKIASAKKLAELKVEAANTFEWIEVTSS